MSMTKLITPGSQEFHEPIMQLVKFSSQGLIGDDLQRFIKRASVAFVDKAAALRPRAGEELVHMIAMGASERYGCFPAGTPIQTDAGMQPIETVQPGTMVLTHMNRYRAVTQSFSKPYQGVMIGLKAAGLPVQHVSTDNHPIWVVRAQDFAIKARAACFRKFTGKSLPQAIDEAIQKAQFIRADEVQVGDFIIVPTAADPTYVDELPYGFAYALGLYLAEGCVWDRRRRLCKGRIAHNGLGGLVFSLGTADTGPLGMLKDFALTHGYSLYVTKSKTSDKGLRVELHWKDFAELACRLLGRHSRHKFIHPSIFCQNEDWKRRFLAGYLDGDGSVQTGCKKKRYENTIKASTASLNLAIDLQRLLSNLAIPSNIVKCYNRKRNGCFGKQDFVIYQVNIGGPYAVEFFDICTRLEGTCDVIQRKQSHSWSDGRYTLRTVRKIEIIPPKDTTVYNLEVAEDNSYVTYFAVHNSNRNADLFSANMLRKYHPTFVKYARAFRDHANTNQAKSYGVIRDSAFNERMQRVELLVALNATKEAADRNGGLVADEEMEFLHRNEDYPVSMAIHVPYDVCNSCGNKARTRADYCGPKQCTKYGGCRDNLGQTFDDGHTLGVDNPEGRFFDISRVFRNADRIAFTLGRAKAAADYAMLSKAASVSGMEAGSAALAARLGVATPLWLLSDGPWTDPKIVGQLKIASALIELEQSSMVPSPVDRAFTEVVQPPANDLPSVRNGSVKLAHVTASLAAAGCMLPLRDFLALLTDEGTTKLASVVSQVRDHLPGAFARLTSEPQFEETLRTNPYVPTTSHTQSLQQWAVKHACDWSVDRDRIVERVQRAVIRRPEITPEHRNMCKVATVDQADKLAREYALYQLGTLYAMADRPDAAFRQEAVIRGNFVRGEI